MNSRFIDADQWTANRALRPIDTGGAASCERIAPIRRPRHPASRPPDRGPGDPEKPLTQSGALARDSGFPRAHAQRWQNAQIHEPTGLRSLVSMPSSSTPPVPPLAETLARKVVEHSGDYAIVCTDPDGVIVSWNAAAEALLGWRAAEAIGQCIGICRTTEDPAGQLHAEMREARETGAARGERWYAKQDGGRVRAVGQLTALRENDAVIGYAQILRDQPSERLMEERHSVSDARAPSDPPRFIGVVTDVTTDVTSRRPARQALAESTVREHATAARFQALTELNSAIFWHANADGTLTYLSPQWHALTGQAPEHALPDGWVDALHPDDRPSLFDAWEHARRHGTVYETEKRVRSSDGLDHWYLIRALPQKDAHGEVTEWLGCSVDISERKTAETVLQQSEARWRGLFEQMQEAFFTGELIRDEQDRACDFRMLEVNPAFETIVGITAAQATGASARLALPGLPDDLLERYERIVVSGTPEQYDIRVAALENRWFEARARRIAQDRFAVVFSDITTRKHDEIARFERERRQGFVLALADRLRGITAPGDALDMTSRMLGHYLGASLVAYPVVDVAARVAMFEHGWAPPGHLTCNGPLTLASLGVAPDVELRRGHTLHFASEQHPLHEGARACS
ncbi:MAG: PAS domain S-box protein, partial [Janthinobacterium lividum]